LLFVVMAVSLGCSFLAVARIEGGTAGVASDPAVVTPQGTVFGLLRRPDVASVIAIGGLAQVVLGALDVLLVVLAIEVLGLGESGVGLLNALFGIGSIAAGLGAVRLVGRPLLNRAIGSGTVATAAPLMLAAPFPAATLLFPVAGLGRTYADIAGQTLLHRLVPEESMGRAFGALESLSMAGLALGAGLAPWLVDSIGFPVTLVLVGGVMPVAYLALLPLLRLADKKARVPETAIRVLRTVPEFALLNPIQIERLALDSELERTSIGDAVIREGEDGSVAWVIVDGRFQVSRRGQEVALLEQGEIVGEIALLHSTPRTADVTSLDEGTLLRLDRAAFLEVVTASPSDAHHIGRLAAHRLDQLDSLSD
jgi:hypothetical protein